MSPVVRRLLLRAFVCFAAPSTPSVPSVHSAMLIIEMRVLDIRFPTARAAVGTDAMHPDPDYSAAYVILETDTDLEGHGLTFTIGRGNEVCVAAIHAFREHIVGHIWRI